MDISKVSMEAGKVLAFLATTDLKPDEKIAVLETAAWTIKNVLSAEAMKAMWCNVLQK